MLELDCIKREKWSFCGSPKKAIWFTVEVPTEIDSPPTAERTSVQVASIAYCSTVRGVGKGNGSVVAAQRE